MVTATSTDSALGNGAEAPLSSLALLRLLQLVSPSFPVGAYAYSQGLEGAVEAGWVSDPASLRDWLSSLLCDVLAETDLPLLACAYDAWARCDLARVDEIAASTLALRETKELRAEERQMGAALTRILTALGVHGAERFVGSAQASYVVLFALAAHHHQVPKAPALQGYAFAWAENQVMAATRLFSLGQNDAQRALADVVKAIPTAVEHSLGIAFEDVGRSAVSLCLASAWHEQQYSRLFRS